MNKRKMLVSILVFAMLAFSALLVPAQALVNNAGLSIAGSSTVYPIAAQAAGTFPTYWNGLVTANPSWGASQNTNGITLAGLGSGTAFKTLGMAASSTTSDIGELSRPPSSGEWTHANAANAQIWAIGADSLAIVYSEDMKTWAPMDLTARQVAMLFMSFDAGGSQPYFTTWGQFFANYTAEGGTLPPGATAHSSDPINRICRDFTSGTYDCFDNFFAKKLPLNSTLITDAAGNVIGIWRMAPFTVATSNQDVVTYITSATSTIAFISLGYYEKNTAVMEGVRIQNAGDLAYYAPSQANVISGKYAAYRWLWQATNGKIPATGPNLEKGVFIAYCKMDANTQGGNPNFVTANDYMYIPRAAMAGGQVLDSSLNPYTPSAGQTQVVPRLTVDSNDFFYFMDAYIAYYGSSPTYNPYADINADGSINGNDFLGFMGAYVYYYTTYAPTH